MLHFACSDPVADWLLIHTRPASLCETFEYSQGAVFILLQLMLRSVVN